MEHFVMLKEERRYRVVREEKYEYYMAAPPKDKDPLRMMLEHLGKRVEQKAFVREEKDEYYMAPPPQDDHLRIMLEHLGKRAGQKALVENQKQSCRKGPPNIYVPPSTAHQGTFDVQQPSAGNQVPPSKKHGGVMDCNEVAKLYGGVVFKDYSRNKLPPPANYN